MKKTEWFRADIHKPVREGWYEYKGCALAQDGMAYWTGQEWQLQHTRYAIIPLIGDYWRGLLK